MLSGAAAIHLTAARERELVSDIAPHVRRVVIPNPVEWQDYQELPDPRPFVGKFLGGGSPSIVMFLGRISHVKGLHVLIAAFARIAPTHPDAILVIVGPDDEGLSRRLRALADSLGILSRTKFVGYLGGQEKLAALASATVWVLPSATENFGVAVVEALAAGIPVIISPGVNISDDLAEAGACVECDAEPVALAGAISSLLHNPARRAQLATAGREAARRFSPESVALQMEDLYRSILAEDLIGKRGTG
jgi:glycosyltransferase involved in cell wall biosynthesis